MPQTSFSGLMPLNVETWWCCLSCWSKWSNKWVSSICHSMKWEGGIYSISVPQGYLFWLLHSQGIIGYLGFLLISFRGDSSWESGHPQASFLFKWRDSLLRYRVSQKFGLRISAWDSPGARFFKMSPPYTYSTYISEDEVCVFTILTSPPDSSSQKNFSFKMTTCKMPGFRGGRHWENPERS